MQILSSLSGLYADLAGLKVRATNRIGDLNARSMTNSIFSAGAIGNVTTSRDLTGSTLLAGYDIGTDYAIGASGDATFGTAKGSIGAITVGGTMRATSIAAGIAPGGGLQFGDGDDSVLVSTSLEGAIKSLTVKDALIGSADTAGQHFGVVAHTTIGPVLVGGQKLTLPWPNPPDQSVNIRIVQRI